MELVFEMVGAPPLMSGALTSKTFKQAGGIIGREQTCDWVIPDPQRVLSGQHAEINYRHGAFYLTDISSNGIQLKDSGARLSKGQPHRIEHGSVYGLGDFEILARLIQDSAVFEGDIGRPMPAGSIIPDDGFLELDPLRILEQEERAYLGVDELALLARPRLEHAQPHDYARIDMESLPVPELVMPTPAVEPKPAPQPMRLPPDFWERFGDALGINLDDLDDDQREALALKAATLLKQSIDGLQQSLRTRSELKNELRLAQTTIQSAGNNPLKHNAYPQEVLSILLRDSKPGQLSAEKAVKHAFRDLQAHQVALLAASRAALKGLLNQLSPEQLSLRFERESKPLLTTSGSRWRAYRRLHEAMQHDGDWSERLFARDFAHTYEEQVRLIATLHSDTQG